MKLETATERDREEDPSSAPSRTTLIKIDGQGHVMHYKDLNLMIRNAVTGGARRIILEGVMGQRYIGSASSVKDLYIGIKGTPGNNLGAFLNGPTIEVFGNAQDMTGNTMSSGRIVVHGNAWDVTGLAARGGRILVKGNSGTRVGIHMKAFGQIRPTMIIGGRTGDYLGEYMAGGVIVVLGNGVEEQTSPVGLNIGAGIHGGAIFVRGKIEKYQLGPAAVIGELNDDDHKILDELMSDYEGTFKVVLDRDRSKFIKIMPSSSRPFKGHFDPTPI